MLKHLLIQYQGGGYDGCFWEWNFCYFDDNGNFHDIYSSGRKGCKSEHEIKAFMKENIKDKHFYLYNAKSQKQLSEFVQETNEGLVIGVSRWIYLNTPYQIYAVCSICGQEHNAEDLRPGGYEGCGGIAIKATLMICEDCYATNTCGYCGEFYQDYDDGFKLYGEDSEQEYCNEGYCSYCHDTKCHEDSYCKKQYNFEQIEKLIPVNQLALNFMSDN